MPDPLKPADFHILLALVDGPRHGYDIMKEVERETEHRVHVEVGTLYRILARLHDDGLLQEAELDGRRRNYSLTDLGRRAVQSEAERLADVVGRLRSRNLLPHSEA
jgi:DNA-binding PadR family transcriptional regulator